MAGSSATRLLVAKMNIFKRLYCKIFYEKPLTDKTDSCFYTIKRFNGEGFPPIDIDWKYASTHYDTGNIRTGLIEAPDVCPVCKSTLVVTHHDWWKMGDLGQYMVHCSTCPNGHGHHCEWA